MILVVAQVVHVFILFLVFIFAISLGGLAGGLIFKSLRKKRRMFVWMLVVTASLVVLFFLIFWFYANFFAPDI
jgi:predicted membrane-bound mannosyltransferase